MPNTYNIYCDESCHLENDHQGIMVLGAVWCPLDKTAEISRRIREIKESFDLPPWFEIKWNKVSPSKAEFYQTVLDYFFDDDDLHYRTLVVPDKSVLRHGDFRQTHDDWYYKMYFDLLKIIIAPPDVYRVYLDIKDTRSAKKVHKLHEVLANSKYDFSYQIVERVQNIRSHETQQLQITDLLNGIIAYANRNLKDSPTKLALVSRMSQRSRYRLTKSTWPGEKKVNIFCWRAQ